MAVQGGGLLILEPGANLLQELKAAVLAKNGETLPATIVQGADQPKTFLYS